jgi:hypothetical protein
MRTRVSALPVPTALAALVVLAVLAVLAVLLGGAVAPKAVADAATQPVVPVRTATPADDVNHPGSTTEWWYAEVSDPVTQQTFIVDLNARPAPETVTFWYDAQGNKTSAVSATTKPVTTDLPSVTSSAGRLAYDPFRRAYHLRYDANGYKADIWFDRALPGVTAGPMSYDGQWMDWTVSVGTSTVTGWVQPPGSAPISVDGWRGYHDHNWGDFLLNSPAYTGWEWGVSHQSDGTASVYGGVLDGSGAWQGVLADITPRGTTACQAGVSLSDWSSYATYAYPATVGLSCLDGRLPASTFHVVGPYVLNAGTFAFTEAVSRTTPGSVGLTEHLRTAAHQ